MCYLRESTFSLFISLFSRLHNLVLQIYRTADGGVGREEELQRFKLRVKIRSFVTDREEKDVTLSPRRSLLHGHVQPRLAL